MQHSEIKSHERRHAPLERGFNRLLTPFEIFFNSQSVTGFVLILAVVLALVLANSDFHSHYQSFNELPLSLALGEWSISYSLHHWVNEGFMVLFFFVLGLEIKREALVGDLRNLRHSGLVISMAIGGMLVPATIYMVFADATDAVALRGWGIPMATDTAFALGIMALMGTRVPRSAVLILSALAIVDDLGAVLVISLFYSEQIDIHALLWAFTTLVVLFFFNLVGIRRPVFYLLGGLVLWWLILGSGVHATTAGIMAALAVPARPYAGTSWFIRRMRHLIDHFEELDDPNQSILEQNHQHRLTEQAEQIALKTTTPLQHWGSVLDKPVSLTILPLFAFLNAGLALPAEPVDSLLSPATLGIALGMVAGKAMGISGFAWLYLRSGLASLPEDMRFLHVVGLATLAGIGFTMSLFIAALAFEGHQELLVQARLGILAGSLVAGLLGFGLFVLADKKYRKTHETPQ